MGSPPVLVHPCAPGSMLVEDSTSSSGSGGAPGSPGLGRVEGLVEEDTAMLAPPTEDKSASFFRELMLSDPTMSEQEGLASPTGWKSMVGSFENVLERSLVVP